MADKPTPSSAARPGDPEETAPINAVTTPGTDAPGPGAPADGTPGAGGPGAPAAGAPAAGIGGGAPSDAASLPPVPPALPPYGNGPGGPAGPPYGAPSRRPSPRSAAILVGAAGVLVLLLGGALGFALGHLTSDRDDHSRHHPSMMQGPGGRFGDSGPGHGDGRYGGRDDGGRFGQLPSTPPESWGSPDDSQDDSDSGE